MELNINSTKGLSKASLVVEIVDKVRAQPNIFLYLSRIFSDYSVNSIALKSEIFSYIERILSSPRLLLNSDADIVAQVKHTMQKIYQLEPQKFSIVRGKILENIVYHFGPVTNGFLRNMVYIEPILRDGSYTIGESDVKCDFVFCQDESYPTEFIECKANIANIVHKTLPFEKIKNAHQNKITYLDNAFRYLKDNNLEPKIYFACYNLNYTGELNNLQNNWGFTNIEFVNAEEIINGKEI